MRRLIPPAMAASEPVQKSSDSDGYARCHRADHGGEGEHHTGGRAWTGRQAAGAVRVRFSVPCGPDCIYPD
jgi:hypothetical protein